jgi:DNA-binding response OmpR family regulator
MARILLIDDNDVFRTMLRQTLTHFHHTVIEARNGKEGLKLFSSARADLVITDLVMPETEGLEVLIELRKAHPAAKLIAISGGGRGSGTDYLHMAAKLGANRVLTKPFHHEALLAVINELLATGEPVPAPAPGVSLPHPEGE